MKKILFVILASLCIYCCTSSLYAAQRSFPGIDIVTRSERSANEAWRYFSEAGYRNRIKKNESYEWWLVGSGTDSDGAFQKRKSADELEAKRIDFLKRKYPADITTDTTIVKEGGKRLLWPFSYKKAKTKIILHHTVTNRVTTPESSLQSIQDIYKYHVMNNQRGDIGYNFLIDPLGSIYEGRAGGPDVVAAHADRNNVSTIGISLMGNFDIHTPSLRMWQSLKKTLLALMLQYDIDPDKKQSYFTASNEDPWLVVHEHPSLVGHSDTKSTACPGHHIEKRLPLLREQMSTMLDVLHTWSIKSLKNFSFQKKSATVWATQDTAILRYDLPDESVLDCALFSDDRSVTRCGGDGNNLLLELRRLGDSPSGWYPLLIKTDNGALWIDLYIVRDVQIQSLLKERSAKYPTAEVKATTKIEKKITPSVVQDSISKPIGVLLYEPTTTLSSWEFRCETACTLVLDDLRIQATTIVARPSTDNPEQLDVFVDLKKYTTTAFRLLNPRSIITITNFSRGSEAYPLNYFRGDISITYQSYTIVDKVKKKGWTVVNHVYLPDYLAGVAETIETQHPEKLRAMALLTKSYILYYLGGNRHPSVSSGVTYQAIDDPRLFQKYVGAGREQTSRHRQKALERTKTMFIRYDGYIPILPYFHCSAGFIRSAREKRGRTDTPWLIGKIDVATCESGTFEGHGVGLSGDGAEKLARAGATAEQILQYYYEGIVVK